MIENSIKVMKKAPINLSKYKTLKTIKKITLGSQVFELKVKN
jgi:hypothetical protein